MVSIDLHKHKQTTTFYALSSGYPLHIMTTFKMIQDYDILKVVTAFWYKCDVFLVCIDEGTFFSSSSLQLC